MLEQSNYDLLIKRLDHFIRKYYINKLIKGVLYTAGVVIALFLIFNLMEYFFYFGKGIRKFLFFGFVLSATTLLVMWVLDPLIRYFKLGKTISHEQAALIIGKHFENVQDKLLNILQLKKQTSIAEDRSLIEASIQQKSSEINPVPFNRAIDLSKNRKYLRYALPPAMIFILLLFAAPSIITDSTYRIVNNNRDFERDAPFHFIIENQDLKTLQFSDYILQVNASGQVVPDQAYIEINNFQYKLQKSAPGKFTYTFKNVQKDTPFRLSAGKVISKPYSLEVLSKPHLNNMQVELRYPAYVGRKNENLSNTGDLVVPEGTRIAWNIDAKHTDELSFSFSGESMQPANRQGLGQYYFNKMMTKNEGYKIYYSNNHLAYPDSVAYSVSVIKDQYPVITIEAITDSLDNRLVYFIGAASDDYGIKEITFHLNITGENGMEKKKSNEAVLTPSATAAQFNHILDIEDLMLKPGDKLTYYFEVWDNDAINGSKSSRSAIMMHTKPTFEEFRELEQMNEEKIKEELLKSIEETRKLKEELQKLREKLLQQQDVNWQDKKELEKLLERQKEIQEKLNSARDKFDENLNNQKEFNPLTEDLLQKQDKINELFDKVMDKEMQELMDKIQELMQELKKDDLLKMLGELEQKEQLQQMDMNRLMNLYKQLEMEKEITEQAKALEKLADRQEELSDQTKDAEGKNEELISKQEKLNEEFDKISQKMEELQKKNEELSPPKGMDPNMEERMNDIGKDMEDSKEKMQKEKNKDASKNQKNAAQKMRSAASNMMEQMQSGEMEQVEEDIRALRQLLENLIDVSFSQEDLTLQLRSTVANTPEYVKLIQDQFKLKGDFKLIEDSLYALSLRRPEIETYVTDKTLEIKHFVDKSIGELEERFVPEAMESQRNTMKNVNDLALMLSESLQNMQMQMASMMPGNQMCTNPGGAGDTGNVPVDKITEGQQGMEGDLQQMKERMQNGEGNSAQDYAKAAARQAALRRALEDLQRLRQEEGKGGQEFQDIIDQMDKMEIDLVNKKLDNETMMRQQDIITRLLEAEKADQQREWDEKRKAEQAKEKRREFPPSLQDYLKQREAEIEMYKTISPDLKPNYKILVNEYHKALKGEK
ncbi:MAG TPA: DUF4175 domain-containing protein [Saprospiraceae bacterium]|nr:DUF4175 domain-containing protein [Saprospiraceae bacterium]